MKLPFFKKKNKEEYYLALVLRDEKISAIIFKQLAGNVTIVSKSEESLNETPEKTPLDDLVVVIDKVISHAETRLPANIEIKDTIFGVKDSWVEDKKISKEYLMRLKHICDELNLTPIGFIVLSEAIAHLISQEEAAPVTALIAEVGKYTTSVSLFRAGKLLKTVNKPITTTPMHSVDEALGEFESVEILPPRLILFQSLIKSDSENKDDLSQKFIAHQWSKSLPFTQIPQISILPHEFDGKAIVSGAAMQLGFTLANLSEDIKNPEIRTIEPKHTRKSHIETDPDEKPETKKESVNEPKTEDFGFVLDQDIATIPPSEMTLKASLKTKSHDANFDKEINEETLAQENEDNLTTSDNITINDNSPRESNLHKKRAAGIHLPFVSMILNKIKNISKVNFSSNKKIIFIPPLVLVLLIGLALLYIFQLKATVTLYVTPKSVNETERITLSTKSDNDFTQNIIAAKELNVPLEGSTTTDATGEKEIGDKAKGTITIFNSDTEKKTFKEGTEISSEKGLDYVIDKEVSVASASGDIFTGIKSGTAQVAVTATKIGTEYNLPSNSKFSIEGTDTVAAKNESAFSGGSKKKVTVVTEKDVNKLKEDLPKSLEKKAQEELRKKLAENEELLTDFISITLTKEALDHKVDTETKVVKLSGTVSFKAVAYDKDDLLKFAQESLQARYKEEHLSEDNINTKLSGIKDKSETELTGVAAINAGLLPRIDLESIKAELAGKSFTDVKSVAKNVSSQIRDVEIKLFPNLNFLPQTMPHRSNNINVIVKTQ